MKKRKSVVVIDVLILLAIGIVAFFVLAVIFPKLIGKSATRTSDLLDSTQDFDRDGVANYFDRCICIPALTDDGCPSNMDDEEIAKSKYEGCPDEIIPKYAKKKN